MGGRSRVVPAALALLLLLVSLPAPVAAEHCYTSIAVYGRPAFAPAVLPPVTPRVCVNVEMSGAAGHVLAPRTTEIFVRVEANLGGSYPLLTLKLDGLGFHEQTFQLVRVQNPGGMWSYNLRDWLTLPDPVPGEKLRATVRFPGNYEATAEYTLLGV